MNQIRNNFLKKKMNSPVSRHVVLMEPDKIKSVLIVTEKEDNTLKRKVEELFPSASVYHLFTRDIKEDNSKGFYYTVNKSDFNLTGVLKNDKLKNLESMQIDLLVDLSAEEGLLDYFVSRINATLKVGQMYTEKSSMYDLLIQLEGSKIQQIEKIYDQLKIFTINAN
ncbi:hypothetical protein K6119_19395 [Paracrocinitomix mangrovi]|uniref:DUF6913 domain-containing protein n=1 Tax=Paracrocinitomix mangrovi TaxID=2862509 RepID=UPI001C8E949C|nr:hypothetical protein [Paracrocinitomix mangrovi]UKN01891.1 hypothetical protein K6119_19395 [Paracrocinitomix mangrovi]